MPLLGFTLLKESILNGTKRQTIRKLRKYPIKVGDKLYLYWKLRTKECEKLGEETCTEEFKCWMMYNEDWLDSGKPVWRFDRELPNGGILQMIDYGLDELARRDGFMNAAEMMAWFHKRYGKELSNLTFQVIRW